MEGIHGIDVSWIHTHNKDSPRHHKDLPVTTAKVRNTSPGPNEPVLPEINLPIQQNSPSQTTIQNDGSVPKPVTDVLVPKPAPALTPKTVVPASTAKPIAPLRPGFARGNSSDRALPLQTISPKGTSPGTGRRNSWLSSISSKFSPGSQGANNSSGSPQAKPATTAADQPLRPIVAYSPRNAVLQAAVRHEGDAPYTPAPPKNAQPNFLQSALRRLSSGGGQLSASGRSGQHGLCERVVLNVDPNRERCKITELDQSKLRRVAFCVDVEIAGCPRYVEEEVEDNKKELTEKTEKIEKTERTERTKKKKLTEKGEGDALKRPRALPEENDNDAVAPTRKEIPSTEVTTTADVIPDGKTEEPSEKVPDKKKEKKKRTEEERKARKEKKRKLAEANGTIPVELIRNNSESSLESTPPGTHPGTPRTQASPTTDPARIYRRCCQLRETPILKKITEQLSAVGNVAVDRPGVVNKLDLSGYWLQLPDLITLGDYLAVVPVKELVMENCGLTDEGVRVILAGLLAAKFPEFTLRKKPKSGGVHTYVHQGGVVERVVLKNNVKIGRDGWRHICLFNNMCRTLKSLDLSMVPFPQSAEPPNGAIAAGKPISSSQPDMSGIFSKSLAARLGGSELELLNMAETGLNTDQLGELIKGICSSGLRRLGLAGNSITAEGMQHIGGYLKKGKCEGLDLGGNHLKDTLHILVDSLDEDQPLWALSLSNCELTPDSLSKLFPALAKLKNFRFIDLSHNHDLFESNPSALALFRRYVPKMTTLKRIHLTDVSMTPEQAVALAEILPESPGLAHVNIMENPQLSALANATDEAHQEEACALYASLMAAVRVSKSLVCIDIDVPSAESSEVVKALAKQVVAYCLRNMERGPVAEAAEAAASTTELLPGEREVAVPDVLLHLVGHVEGHLENHDDDEPAPDDDYVIGGTGVVKALGICLRNKMNDSRRPSQDRNADEGASTPKPASGGKAKDMSKNLLGSARKIRARLQPALLKEEKTGDRNAYQKLLFLDSTLERMIKRFEDEYPETRLPSTSMADVTNSSPSEGSLHSLELQGSHEIDQYTTETLFSDDDGEEGKLQAALSRHNSDVSLASKALSQEEGRMHRFGQQVRRDILNSDEEDHHFDSANPDKGVSEPHLRLLRGLVDEIGGDELKRKVEEDGGLEMMAKEVNEEASVLRQRLIKQDPDGWEKFRESQEAAKRNQVVAGLNPYMSAIE